MLEQRVGDGLAAARARGPRPAPGVRDAGQLERTDDVVLPLGYAAHAFAQVEDEVRAAAGVEPAHVVPDWNPPHLVVEPSEDRGDIIDRFHHARDVLGRPVFGAGIVEDDDLHALAAAWAAGIVCPVIRVQAIRTTSWIRSS